MKTVIKTWKDYFDAVEKCNALSEKYLSAWKEVPRSSRKCARLANQLNEMENAICTSKFWHR